MNWFTPTRGAWVYFGLGLAALCWMHLRAPAWARDPGGYRSEWRTRDKFQHFFISAILCGGAMILLNVDPGVAFIITFVLGLGYEVVEGWVDPKDLTADALGALFATLIALYGVIQ